jgi:hypothetical protein
VSALAATMPSLLIVRPLRWTFGDLQRAVPIPAMSANVAWNLATNTALALALAVMVAMR